MNIKNSFNKQCTRFQNHLDSVAKIQEAEGARQAEEMKNLVAYQDTYRAERREAAAERKKELFAEVERNNAAKDARNAAVRQKIGKMAKSVSDFFSRKWF